MAGQKLTLGVFTLHCAPIRGLFERRYPSFSFHPTYLVFSPPFPQMTENQVRDRARELEELQEAARKHGGGSGGREEQPEVEAETQALQADFQQLMTPLSQRRGKLEAAKAVHQFYRDLADELVSVWVSLLLPLTNYDGREVQKRKRKRKRENKNVYIFFCIFFFCVWSFFFCFFFSVVFLQFPAIVPNSCSIIDGRKMRLKCLFDFGSCWMKV